MPAFAGTIPPPSCVRTPPAFTGKAPRPQAAIRGKAGPRQSLPIHI